MDAVQRDLNLLLTPDQIDNGGLFIYTTLDPAVQNAATEALETQLTKIERQSGFPSSAEGELSAAGRGRRQLDAVSRRARSSRSTMPAAASARSSAAAIMRRANSIARSRRPIARSVRPSSRSFIRSLSRMGSSRARRSATGRSSRAKFRAREIGRREIPTAHTAGFSRSPTG